MRLEDHVQAMSHPPFQILRMMTQLPQVGRSRFTDVALGVDRTIEGDLDGEQRVRALQRSRDTL